MGDENPDEQYHCPKCGSINTDTYNAPVYDKYRCYDCGWEFEP